ncbi:hypothetical protein KJZ99_00180 [bacterium]|nr:hypothetical protein [bacterium]
MNARFKTTTLEPNPEHPEQEITPNLTDQPGAEQPEQKIAYGVPEKAVFVARAIKLLGRNANASHTEIAELFYDFVTKHCELSE